MGCGWTKHVWVLVAVFALPLRAGADFVHVAPLSTPSRSSDPIVPQPPDTGSAAPSDTTAPLQPISTGSDSPPVMEPQASPTAMDLPLEPVASNLPQIPQPSGNSTAHGVRPIALSSKGGTPGVPEPSMLVVAFIAGGAMLVAHRRRTRRRDASSHRA